ncbi:hypothetical protein GCM10010156_66460 [Planobispora rosea]|uniref:TrbL/VirB6 plasmid conjugal transfer protein n=2 Tax=Planobispora rosea TaxID=35762 RepID=A0A8J3WFC7_PLARO|nr:hypothetical protein GCM10010156_66460 [Planobispora rosea]GIH88009.1 hypothetical protein Pro02_64170 [Planobispora rosea]
MVALVIAAALAMAGAAPAAAAAPPWCPPNPVILVACAGGTVVADRADEAAAAAVDKTVLQPLNTLGIKAVNAVIGSFVELWMSLSSLDLDSQGAITLYSTTLSIGWLIAAVLLMVQAMQTMAAGRPAPLLQAFRGLITMSVIALVGVGVTGFLLEFSDALAAMIMGDLVKNCKWQPDKGMGDCLMQQEIVSLVLQNDPTHQAGGVVLTLYTFLLAIILILVLIVQLVVLLLRNATIPILAILLPIAAAGQVGGGATRQWLPKLITAVAAAITYKPMVALIIVAAVRQERASTSASGMLYGLLMFGMSLIAMPALMRAFAPFGLMATGGGGGGLLRTAADVALVAGSISSGGASSAAGATTAADHARTRELTDGASGAGGGATPAPATPPRTEPAAASPPAAPPAQPTPTGPPPASNPSDTPAGAPADQAEARAAASATASPSDTVPMPAVPPDSAPAPGAPAPSAPTETGTTVAAPSGAVGASADSGTSPVPAGSVALGAAAGLQQQVGETALPSAGPLAAETAPAPPSPAPGDGLPRTPPATTGLTIHDRS